MDSRKKGIIICLVLVLITIGAIFVLSNQKFTQENKKVEVVYTTKFIPVGQEIQEEDLDTKLIPEKYAEGLVQNKKDIAGKASSVSLLKGQYIWQGCISSAKPQTKGMVTIYIPTDLPSSACVVAGDRVDINLVDKVMNGVFHAKEPIYKGAIVRSAKDQSGNEIDPLIRERITEVAANGSRVPVSVGVEVPPEIRNLIVDAASQKAIYLNISEIQS